MAHCKTTSVIRASHIQELTIILAATER